MSNTDTDKPASVVVQCTETKLEITVSGNWSMEGELPADTMDDVRHRAGLADVKSVVLRCSGLGHWDSSLLAFVVDVTREARAGGASVRHELPDTLLSLVKLAFAVESRQGSERARVQEGFLASFGGACIQIPGRLGDFVSFIGDLAISIGRLVCGRSAMRSQDFFESLYECSIRSLGIVAVTSLLFGLILAFVGAIQLTSFGAQIYVAGLVGIGMLRVMGAVMVGIVMAGRIGASYAALIGTMQVNEEVDALETMGISPTDFLVLPRVLSLVIMVPLLTVFADFMGMLGGFLVGVGLLDLSPMEYIQYTIRMVKITHGLAGLIYATAFGLVIAVFGCYHGMRCARSAQGVGQATTTAVVHSLVGIICVTAIITIIFNVLKF